MFTMNWFLDMIKKGYSPEYVMMNVLETRMRGTPMGDNLISLAKSGNTQEIEKIARNLASQQGVNFDEEFGRFKKQFGF